jgi:hypothetical protein
VPTARDADALAWRAPVARRLGAFVLLAVLGDVAGTGVSADEIDDTVCAAARMRPANGANTPENPRGGLVGPLVPPPWFPVEPMMAAAVLDVVPDVLVPGALVPVVVGGCVVAVVVGAAVVAVVVGSVGGGVVVSVGGGAVVSVVGGAVVVEGPGGNGTEIGGNGGGKVSRGGLSPWWCPPGSS